MTSDIIDRAESLFEEMEWYPVYPQLTTKLMHDFLDAVYELIEYAKELEPSPENS